MFDQALARDGYLCVITGIIDKNSFHDCTDLNSSEGEALVTVETAHILSESTMQGIGPAGTSEGSTELKVRFHQ